MHVIDAEKDTLNVTEITLSVVIVNLLMESVVIVILEVNADTLKQLMIG
jgi:hypothetical protein